MSGEASLSSQVHKMSAMRDSQDSQATTEPSELVAVVDDLLNSLTVKFDSVSSEILRKMDEMGKRLDNLEMHIKASNAASVVQEENSP